MLTTLVFLQRESKPKGFKPPPVAPCYNLLTFPAYVFTGYLSPSTRRYQEGWETHPYIFTIFIKELNNTNITKKFEISKYLWKIFCIFFCANSKSWTYITSIFYFELPRYGEDVTINLTCDHPMWLQIIHYTVLYWHLVAGVGFEPHGLQVMSLTSYLCSTPQCLAMMGGLEPPFPIGQLLWRIPSSSSIWYHLVAQVYHFLVTS